MPPATPGSPSPPTRPIRSEQGRTLVGDSWGRSDSWGKAGEARRGSVLGYSVSPVRGVAFGGTGAVVLCIRHGDQAMPGETLVNRLGGRGGTGRSARRRGSNW